MPNTATAAPKPDIDAYLRVLRSAGPGSGPFRGYKAEEKLTTAFSTLMHATADFVDVCRADGESNYAEAHDVIRIMAAMFPKPLDDDAIEAEVARFVVDLDGETEVVA